MNVPFRFRLDYYVKNALAKANCELIAAFLKEIGIDCVLQGLDLTDLTIACDDKSFDALYLGWEMPPPPIDPRQLWHSETADLKGSSNLVGFRNIEVDHLIDQLEFEYDPAVRKKILETLHEKIYQSSPTHFYLLPSTHLFFGTGSAISLFHEIVKIYFPALIGNNPLLCIQVEEHYKGGLMYEALYL